MRWVSGLVIGIGSIAFLVRFPLERMLYAMLLVLAPVGPGPEKIIWIEGTDTS